MILNAKYNVFIAKLAKLRFVKISHFSSFIKKAFSRKFDKLKENSFLRIEFFFYENKMILVHHALDFFPFNAKQKLNLTLPNHGLVLKKVYRVIEFNQKAWLKLWIDMNTELRKKAKNLFEKDLFKLMSNAIFKKAMGNVKNDRYYT